MPIRLAFLCVLQLVSSTSAFAQNTNDFIYIFRGVVQQAIIREAQLQWRQLPPSEIDCIDQALRQHGASVDFLITRGLPPTDPRLAPYRANCPGEIAPQRAGQPSFNCAKVRTPDEIAICSNPELSELDNAVAVGYQAILRARGEPFAKQTNIPLFRARQACGAEIACIRERQFDAIKAYYDLGASVSSSVWSHNGSTLDLVTIGRSRKFFYNTPRTEMISAGAKPGSLLFEGEAVDRNYVGIAFIFNPNCGQIPYQVSGPILGNYEKVILR